jgi:hypothetical protein
MPAIPTVGGVAYFWAVVRRLRVRGDTGEAAASLFVLAYDTFHAYVSAPVVSRCAMPTAA